MSDVVTGRHGPYLVSTDPALVDLDVVHRYLSLESYWAQGRAFETVRESVANSLNFGAYTSDRALVGYARVVTDYCTFAWLCDVFVLGEHRHQGLGVALVEAVVQHPRLAGLKRTVLATGDAHDLYARFGFEPLEDGPTRWMVRRQPD